MKGPQPHVRPPFSAMSSLAERTPFSGQSSMSGRRSPPQPQHAVSLAERLRDSSIEVPSDSDNNSESNFASLAHVAEAPPVAISIDEKAFAPSVGPAVITVKESNHVGGYKEMRAAAFKPPVTPREMNIRPRQPTSAA